HARARDRMVQGRLSEAWPPARRPSGQARRHRRPSVLLLLRRQPLRHRPDPAGGWRRVRDVLISMSELAALIAIDWGTTRFRAWLVGAGGAILERIDTAAGILSVAGGDFGGTFDRLVGPWLQKDGRLPVVASGMIGSRQGWREAPYAECPAGAPDLAG